MCTERDRSSSPSSGTMANIEREIALWWHRMPRLTRFWFAATVIVPGLAYLDILHWDDLTLDFDMTFNGRQVWRPATAVFIHPVRRVALSTVASYLLTLYVLYDYSKKLEKGPNFVGRPAEFLSMLLFNWGCLVISGLLFGKGMSLMGPMALSVAQVWCQLHRNDTVDFWFASRFTACYIPWMIFAVQYLLENWGLFDLMGIVVGHLFYFLAYKYPQEVGCESVLSTPSFLSRLFPTTGSTCG